MIHIPKRVILVIEDELPLMEAIKARLEKNNYEVLTARSVEQAFNHLRDVPNIDLIWLDHYLLGKENGLDFLAKCKAESGRCSELPIFVVSNTASEENLQTYMHLGATKYYVKSDKRLDGIIEDINRRR
jgi:DNA-binding response OmpR family regulator